MTVLVCFTSILTFSIFISLYPGGFSTSAILSELDFKNYTEKLLSYLNPVLSSASHSDFVRCWHAKTDGWAASTFHNNCDGKGPTVTIIKVGNYTFGGYTNVPWHSGKYMLWFNYSLWFIFFKPVQFFERVDFF